MLYTEYTYIATTGAQHMLVAGDTKTYLRFKCRPVYGSEVDWLIPFIGDWHVLYNYQKMSSELHGLKHWEKCIDLLCCK